MHKGIILYHSAGCPALRGDDCTCGADAGADNLAAGHAWNCGHAYNQPCTCHMRPEHDHRLMAPLQHRVRGPLDPNALTANDCLVIECAHDVVREAAERGQRNPSQQVITDRLGGLWVYPDGMIRYAGGDAFDIDAVSRRLDTIGAELLSEGAA